MITNEHPNIEWRTHLREVVGVKRAPFANYVIEESIFDGHCSEQTVVIGSDTLSKYIHPQWEVLVRTFDSSDGLPIPWQVYLVTANDGWVCLEPAQVSCLQAALLEAETVARKLNEADV